MMPHTFRRSKLEASREREIAFVVGAGGKGMKMTTNQTIYFYPSRQISFARETSCQ